MPLRNFTCPRCQKPFQTDRNLVRKYCSTLCASQARRKVRPTKNCLQCGAVFHPNPTSLNPVHCSKRCACKTIAQNRPSTKGWIRDPKGYILLRKPDHPTSSKEGYIMEHRWVMEQVLGRLLLPTEVVHHKNKDKADNRPENLEVMEKKAHDRLKRPAYLVTCPCCQATFPLRGNARAVDNS